MNAGQGAICRDCQNFHPETWEQGHTNPCAMVRWVDNKHRTPALSDDGQRCEEYDGPGIDFLDPGSETESAGTYHGENAPDQENGEPAGCRITGGNQKQLSGTGAVDL